jgi:hypothetical protein
MGIVAKKVKELIKRAETWPVEAQEELVRAITEVTHEIETTQQGVYRLSEDGRAGVRRGLMEMREGKFASDERVAAIFRKARSARRWPWEGER